MTLSQEAMLELMAYADGELEAGEITRIEGVLARDPDAARFVDELRTLGQCVRVVEGERRGGAAADPGIAAAVMAAVEREAQGARVVPLRSRSRRPLVIAATSAVVAMAAAWFLFLRAPEKIEVAETKPVPQPPPVASVVPAPAATATAVAQVEDEGTDGVDLDQVESPHHEVSVFYVPSTANANASSVVVWIDDKGAP